MRRDTELGIVWGCKPNTGMVGTVTKDDVTYGIVCTAAGLVHFETWPSGRQSGGTIFKAYVHPLAFSVYVHRHGMSLGETTKMARRFAATCLEMWKERKQ